MQVSGGHLLAAGLDGGNTLIFALKGQKCKSSPVTGTISSVHNGFDRYGHSIFFFSNFTG
jgi:hypothetical protein